MIYPLVLDLAAAGIPVAVTCRVLGSKQAFYKFSSQKRRASRSKRAAAGWSGSAAVGEE